MVKIPTAQRQSQLSYDAPVNQQQAAVFGQGVTALGGIVQQVAQKERTRQDNDQFLSARTKYDAWNLEFETQASQRKGEATSGLVSEFQEDEKKAWGEINSGLSPRAARAFELYRSEQVGNKQKLHAFAEHQGRLTVAKNNFTGSMAVLKQEMLDTPYDIDTHVAKATQNFDLAVSSGAVLPSQREVFMVEVAGMKKTAWQALYEQAPEEALNQTEKYGISDSMKSVYAEKHKDKVTSTQSLAITNELAGNGKSLKENLDYAHKKYADNPLLHDKIVQRLKLRGAEDAASIVAAKAVTKQQFTTQLLSVEINSNNKGAASEQLASIIESAPPELRKDLTALAKEKLNPSGLTDLEKLAKVEQAVLSKEIRSLEELQTHYVGISRKDQRKLEETLYKTNKGEVPKLTVDKVNRVLAEIGYKKKLTSKDDMKKFNAVHAAYTAFYEERSPQTLAEEQETNLAFRKHMEQEGIIPDGGLLWGDDNLTRVEAVASGQIAAFLPDVDETYQGKLLITTKALGVDAKNRKLLRAHNKAWLPVYESMSEADLQKVISILQRRRVVVTPLVVKQVYERLARNRG